MDDLWGQKKRFRQKASLAGFRCVSVRHLEDRDSFMPTSIGSKGHPQRIVCLDARLS